MLVAWWNVMSRDLLRPESSTMHILHIDMDAFYASIEERDDPSLSGKPLVVGGNPDGRGVVAAANYPARKYGIRSAMPMATARRLCPELVILRWRPRHYAGISERIRDIFHRYTPQVEPVSIDEAFLDVSASEKLFGAAVDIGRRIQQEISEELSLSASVGVAPTKFVAKVASDFGKPHGFVAVGAGEVQAFLDPLPTSRLWGVGEVADRALESMGIRTIGELRSYPVTVFTELFGKWGEQIWLLSQGIDERRVVPDHEARSISHETTFDSDIHDREALRACLLALTEQVAARLRRHGLRGRTVHIKLRYPDFKTVARARTLSASTNVTAQLWTAAEKLLHDNLPARHPGVRLIGMGLSGLDAGTQIQASLFDEDAHERRIDVLTDAIKDRFGEIALRRGLHLKRPR
ncbi:MAG: DNA polymerase IV [Acidiferrobacterales bacterium]